ncbi:MAG TPA: HAMP domain-containing protein, partial [Roseiflexaceae bacterium]|nr:HAMP domain-containing protein [Roseiflexaceae bacterium]
MTGKLTLGVALFIALLALVTASTISVTATNARVSTDLVQSTLPFVHHSDLFNVHTARALAEAEAFVRTREDSDAAEVREHLLEAHARLTALAALVSHTNWTEREQTAHAALLQRQQMLLADSERHILAVFDAIAANDQAALTETLEAIEASEDQFADLELVTTELLDQELAAAIETVSAQSQQELIVAPIGFGLLGLAALLTLWLLRHVIVRPIRNLSEAARVVARGDFMHSVPVTSTDEIGALQASFNQMVSNLAAQRTQVEEQQQVLAQRASELEHTLTELQTSTQERDQLSQSIRDLSTPVLPILNGILVMPLIGVIDTDRS